MARIKENKTNTGKYANLMKDIQNNHRQIRYDLSDGFNATIIDLLHSSIDSSGKISDNDMEKIVDKASFSPFLRTFLRDYYAFKIPEQLLDKLIEITPATEIKFMLNRNELTGKQIDDIILKYEVHMASDLQDYLNEYPNRVSRNVIEHLLEHRTWEFERWEYSPYKLTDNPKHIEKGIELAKGDINEELNLALINNKNIGVLKREEIFKLGCDYSKVENPTPNMAKEIYISASQMAFDYDYRFEYAQKVDQAAKQISKHMSVLPYDCLYDLIRRCEHNNHFDHLITDMASKIEDDNILSEIIKTKDAFKNAKMIIFNKPRLNEKTYYELTLGTKMSSNKRHHCLKLMHTNPMLNEHLLDEFFEKPDKNMLMAMLVSPYNSVNTDNKILHTPLSDSKIETLWLLKQKLNENNQYFAPHNYSVMAGITLRLLEERSSDVAREILSKIVSTKSPKGLYTDEQEKFIREKLTEILKEKSADKDVKKAIKSFIKKFEKDVERDKPFFIKEINSGSLNFPIFKIENTSEIKLSVHNVEFADKQWFNDMIKKLQSLPESTLKKMKDIIIKDIAEDNNYKREAIQYRIYQIADFYNAINDKLKEIEQENNKIREQIDLEI